MVELGTKVPYSVASGFVGKCLAAIGCHRTQLAHGEIINLGLNRGGRPHNIVATIRADDPTHFWMDRKWKDPSNLSTRVSAAAYALYQSGYFGEFQIDNRRGQLKIQWLLAPPQRFALPEEAIDVTKVVEGAIQSVLVNSYERSELARERCIAHYGTACSACGIELGSVYGKAGEGLIHVHHLQQLSDAEKEHVVDPVRDLRPVCPNCHAIIHRRSPPYTIEEVRGFLGKQNDCEEKCVA